MRIVIRNARWIHADRIVEQSNELTIERGQIVANDSAAKADLVIDGEDCIAMRGGIDIHTHIGGGKANLARLLLPYRSRPVKSRFTVPNSPALTCPVPTTLEAGQRYLELGYTTCFEPAVVPSGARHAHYEMIDTPHLSTGGFVLLGNEEILLHRLSLTASDAELRDYVAWMLRATQCMAVKVVNAGGISGFKYNQRAMDLDTLHQHWHITPRVILNRLARAVDQLGLPHPLHVHCSNLGTRGNIASTLATIDAVEGQRIHLTHAQFHSYGSDGPLGYSSAAIQLADRVNKQPELSIDVGQVLFGETVTLSADTMHQFANRSMARPRRAIFQDLECQAGCGVLPFKYRHSQFVNALQWAIGLELFLLVKNPWQIFLTTDHPNGAPFTSYPHLIKLLMNYDFRMEILEQLHPATGDWCRLADLRREYTLEEIAIITRYGPARSLGLADQFNLGLGSAADLVLYEQDDDPEQMFSRAKLVFQSGEIVLRDGLPTNVAASKNIYRCEVPEVHLPSTIKDLWCQYNSLPVSSFKIADSELTDQNVRVRTVSLA